MYFAGIDIGSRGSKGAILEDGRLVSYTIMETGPESAKTSRMVFDSMAEKIGVTLDDIAFTVATGYGRILVPFADKNISEISCHGYGAHYFTPTAKTILDMGGQDCKAIRIDENGRVENFIMNDKCAGGTGRFLEIIADILDLTIEDIGSVALTSENKLKFNTLCAAFAKSEALGLLRKGVAKGDILAGLHDAIATRAINLLKRVGIVEDFTITGGISKNIGMLDKLKEKMGITPVLAEDPQIAGAVGAALFAQERYAAQQKNKAA